MHGAHLCTAHARVTINGCGQILATSWVSFFSGCGQILATMDIVSSWVSFFSTVASLLRDRERNSDINDKRKVEYYCERLEQSTSHGIWMHQVTVDHVGVNQFCAEVESLESTLSRLKDAMLLMLHHWHHRLQSVTSASQLDMMTSSTKLSFFMS